MSHLKDRLQRKLHVTEITVHTMKLQICLVYTKMYRNVCTHHDVTEIVVHTMMLQICLVHTKIYRNVCTHHDVTEIDVHSMM